MSAPQPPGGYPQGPYPQQGYPQQQGYPPAQMAPQPPKKGMSGCAIALLVFAALGVLVLVGAGIAVWRVMQDPDVQKVVKAGKEGIGIVMEAQSAPGTDELRELGCKQAMAMDTQRILDLAKEFADAGAKEEQEADFPKKWVMCQVGLLGDAPSCDAVAKTYFAAAPNPGGRVMVAVQKQGNQQNHCQKVYSDKGEDLGEFSGNAPQMPQ